MGKNNNRLKADDMIKTRWNDTGQQQKNFSGQVSPLINPALQREDQAYNTAYNGYNNLANNLSSQANSKYGLWDPNRVGSIDHNVGEFKDFAHGNTAQGAMYKDWLNTGGVSDAEKADYRSRATSVIPSIYEGAKRSLDRQNSIQGGINPGYTAQSRQIMGDSARQSQQAATGAEVDLANMVRSGKLSAAGNLDQNFMSGMGAANNTELELAHQLADSRSQGTQGLLAALGGIRGLRTDTPGESNALMDLLLKGNLGYGAQQSGLIGDQMQSDAARNSWWKNIISGLAGGIGTGAQLLGAKKLPGSGFKFGSTGPGVGM